VFNSVNFSIVSKARNASYFCKETKKKFELFPNKNMDIYTAPLTTAKKYYKPKIL